MSAAGAAARANKRKRKRAQGGRVRATHVRVRSGIVGEAAADAHDVEQRAGQLGHVRVVSREERGVYEHVVAGHALAPGAVALAAAGAAAAGREVMFRCRYLQVYKCPASTYW